MNTVIDPAVYYRDRVLAAEDHSVNRRLMEFLFADLQCELEVVQNGNEALEAIRRSQFDVVLLDLQMPQLDGFQTAQAIHREFGSYAPRVFAVSADVTEETRARCLESCIYDLLPKPLTRDMAARVLGRESSPLTMQEAARVHGWELSPTFATFIQMGKGEAVNGVLRLFLKESEKRLERLTRALKNRNWEEVMAVAHSLKGSAAQLGAGHLSELCSQLEVFTAEHRSVSVKRIAAIFNEFENVEGCLVDYLDEHDQTEISQVSVSVG